MTTRSILRRVTALAAGCLVAAGLAACAPAANGGGDGGTAQTSNGKLSGKVYMILPDRTTVRFEKFDKPAFEAAMAKLAPDVEVVTLNSENDVQQQLNQVQTAIADEAKAIVMVAVDPDQAAGSLAAAADANIPLICDSHSCNGGPAYAYLIAKFKEIGETQAKKLAEDAKAYYDKNGKPLRVAYMFGDPKYPFYTDQVAGFDEVLKPVIDSGALDVVCQADALLWVPSNSQQAMDQCLTRTDNGVDAILTMNDDLGGGALAAAEAAGLKGITLYGGYDASLDGIQRVAAGIQPIDMAINYTDFNTVIAELVVASMKGEDVPAKFDATVYDNGYKDGIPQIEVNNSVITADDIQKVVVDSGLYTKAEICDGSIAADSTFCTG